MALTTGVFGNWSCWQKEKGPRGLNEEILLLLDRLQDGWKWKVLQRRWEEAMDACVCSSCCYHRRMDSVLRQWNSSSNLIVFGMTAEHNTEVCFLHKMFILWLASCVEFFYCWDKEGGRHQSWSMSGVMVLFVGGRWLINAETMCLIPLKLNLFII